MSDDSLSAKRIIDYGEDFYGVLLEEHPDLHRLMPRT